MSMTSTASAARTSRQHATTLPAVPFAHAPHSPDRNMPEILSQSTRGEEIVPPGRILDAVNDPFQSCVIDDFSN